VQPKALASATGKKNRLDVPGCSFPGLLAGEKIEKLF
jgi:hypothetical protein